MKRLSWLCVPLFAAATWLYVANTTTAQQQQQQQQQRLSDGDLQFMRKANEDNLTEIMLGRIAQANSTNQAVKQFGERMVRDHSRLQNQAREAAQALGYLLPAQLDQTHLQMVQRFSRLTGTAFDRDYARHMVPDHKKALAQFEYEAKNGQNPQIKTLAEKAIPILKEHLRLAEQLQKEVK